MSIAGARDLTTSPFTEKSPQLSVLATISFVLTAATMVIGRPIFWAIHPAAKNTIHFNSIQYQSNCLASSVTVDVLEEMALNWRVPVLYTRERMTNLWYYQLLQKALLTPPVPQPGHKGGSKSRSSGQSGGKMGATINLIRTCQTIQYNKMWLEYRQRVLKVRVRIDRVAAEAC